MTSTIKNIIIIFAVFQTTDYHWEQFDSNATNIKEDSTDETNQGFELVSGPFQFKKAIKLDKKHKDGPQVRRRNIYTIIYAIVSQLSQEKLQYHQDFNSIYYMKLQCLEDTKFNDHGHKNETIKRCLHNPADCNEGFSMSIFYKQPDTNEDYSKVDPNAYEREYLLSTGQFCIPVAGTFILET